MLRHGPKSSIPNELASRRQLADGRFVSGNRAAECSPRAQIRRLREAVLTSVDPKDLCAILREMRDIALGSQASIGERIACARVYLEFTMGKPKTADDDALESAKNGVFVAVFNDSADSRAIRKRVACAPEPRDAECEREPPA